MGLRASWRCGEPCSVNAFRWSFQYRKLKGPKHVLAGSRNVQLAELLNSAPLHVAAEVVATVVVEVAQRSPPGNSWLTR